MQQGWRRLQVVKRTARLFRNVLLATAVYAVLCSCHREPSDSAYARIWRLYTNGAFEQARSAAAREAERYRQSGDAADHWKFRLLEAESLLAQAKMSEAARLIATPVSLSDTNQLELRRRMDQADSCSKSGRFAEAAAMLEQIRPHATDPELQIRMDVLAGAVLGRMRKLSDAEHLLNRALLESERRNDDYQKVSALINLASCSKWRYRYSEAVEYSQRAFRIAQKRGFRRLESALEANLGSLYGILGDFDRALANEEKAVEGLKELGDRGNLLIAMGELGLLYETQGHFEKAVVQYERAFEISKELGRAPDEARNAVNLAEAFIETRQWDKAFEWNERARSLVNAQSRSMPYIEMNSARIAQGRGDPATAVRAFEGVLRDRDAPPSLLWDCHSLLANLYVRERKPRDAGKEFRAALDIIDKTRSDLLESRFQITFLSSLINFHQEYVDFLVDQHDEAGALHTIESSRARVLSERLGRDVGRPGSLDMQRLSKLAGRAKTVLLSFWIAPRRSFAWLIDRSGVHSYNLPPAAEIEELVTKYRGVVEHALRDPIASGDAAGPKLWNALLRDIAPRIPKGSRVVVIPDGPLHRLNLETLPVPGPGPHYWIDDVELAVAPSLAIATAKGDAPPHEHGNLLLIGAPDYSGTDFRPLEKAPAELADIKAQFPGAALAIYEGRRASPDAYRNSQPSQYSLIHFAAHADANNENPLESAIVLSTRGDSNKLYARDVIDVPISADLVTISGCRSAGVRTYGGEGLIGFAWAFLQAGARAVVAGLWDVSDTSTEPLMNEFYRGIAAGESPAAAMHAAKVALRQKHPEYSKPFYWAPFQVYIRSAANRGGGAGI